METDAQRSAADDAWNRLDDIEDTARAKLSQQLVAFEGPFRDTYEAGVIAPVLRAEAFTTADVRCAALHFKRVLNDLRSVWLLLASGYTSQAASVAASLYENALGTVCLTISPRNVETYLASESGELPWAPIKMAKMVVEHEGHAPGTKDFENQWRALYAHYVWLCQTKHPTMPSAVHDSSASAVRDGYVVMALPNVHAQDLPLKAQIAIISLHRTHESIQAFLTAFGFKEEPPNTYRFAERFSRAKDTAWNAYEPFLERRNPISIHRTWFPKKYPPIK
ncbi:MAG: hypothetical protein QOI04_97 [Verrucomicrobiota bacterium]|jgi:hypothetical protein